NMNAYASLFLVLRTAHSKAPVRHFLFNEKLKTSPSLPRRSILIPGSVPVKICFISHITLEASALFGSVHTPREYVYILGVTVK
ncbi:hypothetical protein, partial [[Bacillus] enclensis]|uniref:hypothetical protein n=1 Tax=[Bacillus] enclensis TaxID=1402860 RepID=UPI001E2BC74B